MPPPDTKGLLTLGDIPTFPYTTADRLVASAERLGVKGVDAAMTTVHRILGDPARVLECVGAWSPTAKGQIFDSAGHITAAAEEVTEYWTGDAATRFDRFVRGLSQDMTNNATVLQNIAEAVCDLYGNVLDTYKLCLTFISECARTVIGFQTIGSAASELSFTALGIAAGMAAMNALKDLVKSVNDAVAASLEIQRKYAASITKIQGMAVTLKFPDCASLPSGLDDDATFYPKQRTPHPP
jgi:hypothetical protein